MTVELSPPNLDKLVTIITMDKGEALVTHGTVLVSKQNLVAVAIAAADAILPRAKDNPATIIYGDGDLTFLLRGRVMEAIKPDRLVISTPQPPRIGERREFIRADISLDVRIEKAPDTVTTPEAARTWTEDFTTDDGAYCFQSSEVDLSGSGVRLNYPVTDLRKGDYAIFTCCFPDSVPQTLLHLPAVVVRAKPAQGIDEAMNLALTFLGLKETESDLLNVVVFEARTTQYGVGTFHPAEVED
jgi:hypothetical protein